MNLDIVIIDDHMEPDDPLIMKLKRNFRDAHFETFQNANDGAEYTLAHLDRKIVVFLDCRFDVGISGFDALKRIREKTSLVYIVMMSANSLVQLDTDDFLQFMINHRGIFFINNRETDKAVELVHKVNHLMDTKLDCILEQWVLSHDDKKLDAPYIIDDKGNSLTLKNVLDEVRQQTELGETLERNIILLAIDLLTRNKRKLADD